MGGSAIIASLSDGRILAKKDESVVKLLSRGYGSEDPTGEIVNHSYP